jgi:hypothetical protein
MDLSQLCVQYEAFILFKLTTANGSPRKVINFAMIEHLRSMKFTWQQIADVTCANHGLSNYCTLWRRFSELGLSMSWYSEISDSDLDSVMESMVQNFP